MFNFVEQPIRIRSGEFTGHSRGYPEKVIVSPGICPTFLEPSDIRNEEYPQAFTSAPKKKRPA